MEETARAYIRDEDITADDCASKSGNNPRMRTRTREYAKGRAPQKQTRRRKKNLPEKDPDLSADVDNYSFDDDLGLGVRAKIASRIARRILLQNRLQRVAMRVAARLMVAQGESENEKIVQKAANALKGKAIFVNGGANFFGFDFFVTLSCLEDKKAFVQKVLEDLVKELDKAIVKNDIKWTFLKVANRWLVKFGCNFSNYQKVQKSLGNHFEKYLSREWISPREQEPRPQPRPQPQQQPQPAQEVPENLTNEEISLEIENIGIQVSRDTENVLRDKIHQLTLPINNRDNDVIRVFKKRSYTENQAGNAVLQDYWQRHGRMQLTPELQARKTQLVPNN